MPIDYTIDHERRLVMAQARGVLTDEDVFGYQRELWSRADVAGYNELVDMSHVEQIVQPSADRVRQLAGFAASMDSRSSASRFAIVAATDYAFGLGRVFQTFRGMDERSTKKVGVFRSLDEALAFLAAGERSAAEGP